MKKGLVHEFLVELHHKYLQPLGFKKENRTFVRNKGNYTEKFYFKSRGDLLHGQNFQLYVGVEFPDLPETNAPKQANPPSLSSQISRPFRFSRVHWFQQAEILVPQANYHRCATFKLYSSTDYSDLIEDLAQYIPAVSDSLASEIKTIRGECMQFSHEQP